MEDKLGTFKQVQAPYCNQTIWLVERSGILVVGGYSQVRELKGRGGGNLAMRSLTQVGNILLETSRYP